MILPVPADGPLLIGYQAKAKTDKSCEADLSEAKAALERGHGPAA